MKHKTFRLLFAASFFLAISYFTVSAQVGSTSDPAAEEIRTLAKSGQVLLAIERANSVLAVHPNRKAVLLARAALFAAFKPGDAIADYTRYITLTPPTTTTHGELASVHQWRAEMYILNGDHEAAVNDMAKAIQFGDEKNVEALVKHARIHLKPKDAADTISDYTKVIALVPAAKAAKLYFNRGRINADNGNLDSAIADYTKMTELSPGDLFGPYYLGRLYARKNDHAGAVAAYTKAIRNYKTTEKNRVHELYNMRGEAHSANGDRTSAIADYTKSIELEPDQEKAFFERIKLNRELKTPESFTAAIADLSILIKHGKEQSGDRAWMAERYYDRGVLHTAFGAYDKALVDINDAMILVPDNPQLYSLRSFTYCNQGKIDLAKTDEAKVVQLGAKVVQLCVSKPVVPATKAEVKKVETKPVEPKPATPMTAKGWFDKGEQHLDARDLDDAVAAFTKAIALRPGYAEAFGQRAVAYFAGMGQTDALADINKAIALDPTNPEYYLTRAGFHCFRSEGDPKSLALAKRDEAKAVQLGGKVEQPCK